MGTGMTELVQFCDELQEALDMATGIEEPVPTEQTELVLAAGRLIAAAPGTEHALRQPRTPATLHQAIDSLRGSVSAIRSSSSRTERDRHLGTLEARCGTQVATFEELCCLLVPGCRLDTVGFRLSNFAQQATLTRLRSDVAHELRRLDDALGENYELEEKRAAGYERRLAEYAAEVDGKMTAHEGSIDEQKKNVQKAKRLLDQTMKQAKDLVRDLGENAARDELERSRDGQRKQADRWRAIAFWIGIGSFLILVGISFLDRSLPLANALELRIPAAAVASTVFGFAVSQSHSHRRDERKYREDIIRMAEVNYLADQSPDEYAAVRRKVLIDLMAEWATRSSVNLREEPKPGNPSRRNRAKRPTRRETFDDNMLADDDRSVDGDR
jgi:hypothetical protein